MVDSPPTKKAVPAAQPATGAPNHYILVAADAYRESGSVIGGYDTASRRLAKRRWPIYETTRHRKDLKPADRVVIYIAGSRWAKQSFIASAYISTIETTGRLIEEGIEGSLGQSIWSFLVLDNIHKFEAPIKIKDIATHLDFFPVDNKKWGTILMGGARKISEHDFQVIEKI